MRIQTVDVHRLVNFILRNTVSWFVPVSCNPVSSLIRTFCSHASSRFYPVLVRRIQKWAAYNTQHSSWNLHTSRVTVEERSTLKCRSMADPPFSPAVLFLWIGRLQHATESEQCITRETSLRTWCCSKASGTYIASIVLRCLPYVPFIFCLYSCSFFPYFLLCSCFLSFFLSFIKPGFL